MSLFSKIHYLKCEHIHSFLFREIDIFFKYILDEKIYKEKKNRNSIRTDKSQYSIS